MPVSNSVPILTVSRVEFTPVDRYLDPDFQGRVSFCVNGFVWFLNLEVYRAGEGIRIKFPAIGETQMVLSMSEEVRTAIERQVAEQLKELVR